MDDSNIFDADFSDHADRRGDGVDGVDGFGDKGQLRRGGGIHRERGSGLLHGHITGAIIGALYSVHSELGAGFLEGVYANALSSEMQVFAWIVRFCSMSSSTANALADFGQI